MSSLVTREQATEHESYFGYEYLSLRLPSAASIGRSALDAGQHKAKPNTLALIRATLANQGPWGQLDR